MDKKTTGMIATIAAIVLCGCPGLCMCIFGAWGATGTMPYTTTVNGYTDTGTVPSGAGIAMLCTSLLLIAIPVVVWFFTLRKKPGEAVMPVHNEPLPPAS